MTSFENYFFSLKTILKKDFFDIWPDFEPDYDEREYAWTDLRGLGESLLLNCGKCDGPSDMRHDICRNCVGNRRKIAKKTYKDSVGRSVDGWKNIILCRIHTEE